MRNLFSTITLSLVCGLLWSQSYINVAFEQGIYVLVEGAYVGCGASFYDFDGDGWDDLTLCSPGNDIHFFKNNLGILEPAPFSIDNTEEAKMPLWGDFDNDGDADLLITKAFAQTRLYRNMGDMIFQDITEEVGLPLGDDIRSYGAAWGDYDRDGWNDLYICNYNFNDERTNFLLKNNEGQSFTVMQDSLGVSNEVRPSFQPTFLDYNRDLNPDIYVINDKIHPNALYANNGDGSFTDVSEDSGAALVIDAMSNSVADFDHDGDLDIYVTNATAGNKFLVNNGDGTYEEMAEDYALEVFSICWGALWVDYDNNGWEDLHVLSTFNGFAGNQNYFYLNQDTAFTDGLSVSSLIYDYHSSYSNVKGDLNNDGYPEILVNNEAPDYATLWQNTGGSNNWAKLDLEGLASNRDGIGAWLTWHVNGQASYKYTQCGGNYMGQNSQYHTIGLGEAGQIDSLQVEWPSGIVDTFYTLEAGEVHSIVEGSTLVAQVSVPNGLFSCPGDSVLVVAEGLTSATWSNGLEGDSVYISLPGSYTVSGENAWGIAVSSDTLYVDFFPLPEIEALVEDVSCFGMQDASVTFFSSQDAGIEVVPGTETMNATAWLPAGNFVYLMEDSNGCRQEVDVAITQPEILAAEIAVNSTEATWILNLDISGGSPPYLPLWNTGENETSVAVNEAGTYSCWITDANDCLFFAEVEVEESVGVVESEGSFMYYPNPALDKLTVLTSSRGELRLVDLQGKIVFHSALEGSGEVFLEGISAGSYLLLWTSAEGQHRHRLVIH